MRFTTPNFLRILTAAYEAPHTPSLYLSITDRNDQLTFMPPEDHATPTQNPSPGVAVGEKNGASPNHVAGGAGVQSAFSNVLYGSLSAECVVRRASKVLEVLGTLNGDGGLARPAGVDLVENIHARLLEWSRGEHGRSVPSARTCAPVRVDTSEQARREFFGLGVGDRVLSTEGEATVLGATRHSLWVAVDSTSLSSACSLSFRRGPRVWGSEGPDMRQEDTSRGNRGHNISAAAATATSSPSLQRIVGRRGSKVTPWSRSTVRRIIGRPEDYVVSRHPTSADSVDHPDAVSSKEDLGSTGQHDSAGTAASVVVDHLSKDEVQNMMSRWTPTMDETLGHHLTDLAYSVAVANPLDLPFNALKKLPPSTDMFPSESPLAPANVWARATLLLYVNDLVLPLLPLLDTSSDGRGPLSALVRKCRHLLLKQTKLSLLDK